MVRADIVCLVNELFLQRNTCLVFSFEFQCLTKSANFIHTSNDNVFVRWIIKLWIILKCCTIQFTELILLADLRTDLVRSLCWLNLSAWFPHFHLSVILHISIVTCITSDVSMSFYLLAFLLPIKVVFFIHSELLIATFLVFKLNSN